VVVGIQNLVVKEIVLLEKVGGEMKAWGLQPFFQSGVNANA